MPLLFSLVWRKRRNIVYSAGLDRIKTSYIPLNVLADTNSSHCDLPLVSIFLSLSSASGGATSLVSNKTRSLPSSRKGLPKSSNVATKIARRHQMRFENFSELRDVSTHLWAYFGLYFLAIFISL